MCLLRKFNINTNCWRISRLHGNFHNSGYIIYTEFSELVIYTVENKKISAAVCG